MTNVGKQKFHFVSFMNIMRGLSIIVSVYSAAGFFLLPFTALFF